MTHTARTRSRSTLLTLWLMFAATSPLLASAGLASQPPAETSLHRAEWSLVRPTPIVTLHIRQVIGYVMLVPAGTLFLLYIFRPRPYVLAGALAWAAGSVMLLALSFNTGAVPPDASAQTTITVGRLGIAAWAIASLMFGAALRCASVWFRRPSTIPGAMAWTLIAAVIWIGLGAALMSRAAGILVPAFVLMTAWHLRSAYGYLQVVRRYRFVGAALAGIGVFAMAIVNIGSISVASATGAIGQASANVAYLNVLAASLMMLGMHLLIFEDLIEELRAAAAEIAASRDELKTMAVTDPLTRCYNRRLLYEIADHELERHRRYNVPLSILYIDVDHFKAINDQRGHHTGDEVLKTLGAILRELTRQADFVFRWGGDEFLVLLSAAEADARVKAAQIRTAFLESAIVGDLPDGVDVSIGCVPVPPETRDFDPLIDQADREMYRRKRALAS
jgi:diguanylate cyclase (GGDEF)-like protein